MYIRVRYNEKIFTIPDLSKLTTINQLRKILAKHDDIGVPADRQRILFKGKQLENGNTLYDYDFRRNDLADLTEKVVVKDEDSKASCSTSSDVFKDEVSVRTGSTRHVNELNVLKLEMKRTLTADTALRSTADTKLRSLIIVSSDS